MITELKLQNFRCFNEHTIPFKQMSIVIGRNNAGKSTVVEALRLISIVVSRYKFLAYRSAPDWAEIPRREVGVSPSLKGMEFNFSTVFHRYGDPPSIISASFDNDSAIKIYLGEEDRIHAVVFDQEGNIVKTRAEANKLEIPSVEIMPQVAPVVREERALTRDYVKGAMSSHLAPLHFRNQLRVIKEYFPVFKEMAETTWPGLQIRELTGGGIGTGDPLQLMVRDEDFVAEIASMGHGLQMWLQTMWFLARSSEASTVILDEPDVYMHADIQRRLIRYIKNRVPQIIVTTHSVEIMSEVDIDEILIIDRRRPRSRFAGTLPAVQKLIEHIGSVHNIHLAKLWHSRRCILVEGKDVKLLSELHNVIFPESVEGFSAYPNMPIGGWGGWNYAIGSSMLLKNAGGQSIAVYCILDSDYHTEIEIAKRKQEAKAAGVQLRIWELKEIENYLLVPSAIRRVIASRVSRRKAAPSIEEIVQKLEKIFSDLKDEIFDAFSAEIYAQDRKLGAAGANKVARAYLVKKWKTYNGRLSVVSGKEVLSRLSKWSQDRYSVSLSASLIARQLKLEEIPNEVIEVIRAIENCENFSR
ncbi:MAG: AAA family ATPase [Deltaproteobacteria bacterium]|nr:AAA family ATPase [Deltaproteobacteria bacterium]